MHCFITSCLICADPDLKAIGGGGREGNSKVRRRVEGAAVAGAVLSIPECYVVRAVTEVVVTNKGRRPRKIGIIAITAIRQCCCETPNMLTW